MVDELGSGLGSLTARTMVRWSRPWGFRTKIYADVSGSGQPIESKFTAAQELDHHPSGGPVGRLAEEGRGRRHRLPREGVDRILLTGVGCAAEAASFVREIEQAKPPDAIALSALGFAIAHSSDGKIRDIPLAMRRARRATELDGSQPSYWTALGAVLVRAGENLEAVKALTKAASLHQTYSLEVGLLLAIARFRAGDLSEARKDLHDART